MRWTRSWWYIALLLLGILLATAPAAVAGRVDWDALFAGEVAVEAVKQPDGLSGIRASFTVAASREHIWDVLIDYVNFPKIFPDIHTLRVLMQDHQGAKLEYWVKTMLSKYHYVLHRQYDEPGRRLTWTRVSGDLKRMEGSWEIRETPRPDIQMLVYELYVDIGGIMPAALVRAEAMRRTRAMGERLRSWIEGRPMSE